MENGKPDRTRHKGTRVGEEIVHNKEARERCGKEGHYWIVGEYLFTSLFIKYLHSENLERSGKSPSTKNLFHDMRRIVPGLDALRHHSPCRDEDTMMQDGDTCVTCGDGGYHIFTFT
jgi:hypothetical protein